MQRAKMEFLFVGVFYGVVFIVGVGWKTLR